MTGSQTGKVAIVTGGSADRPSSSAASVGVSMTSAGMVITARPPLGCSRR
jgi:hypothetical protein